MWLITVTGKLPPYKADYTVDTGSSTAKGMIIYDLLTSTVLHHVAHYLEPSVPADTVLLSRQLSYAMDNFTMYNGRQGQYLRNVINFNGQF